MKYRRYLQGLVSGVAMLLLASASALASTFNLPFPGTIGGTKLDAGRYEMKWQEHSPSVSVSVAKGKNVVATVQGRIEERSSKFQRNMVVYSTKPDGSQVITELRVGGTNRAIVFEE